MASMLSYIKTIGKNFINSICDRSIKIYIQKHLGQFLKDDLSLDQIAVGLEGGLLNKLHLNAEVINESIECANLPFTVLEGYIDELFLHIPWSKFSTDSILVEVDGLELMIRMKEQAPDEEFDMKSMLESMTASMMEEVRKSDEANADAIRLSQAGKDASPFQSVEVMSDLISAITSKIQIKLNNVSVKTERGPGVTVRFLIEELDYYDKDTTTTKEKKSCPQSAPTPVGFSTKMVEVRNVRVTVEEAESKESAPKSSKDPAQESTEAFNVAMNSPPNSGEYMHSSMMQSIYPGMSMDGAETCDSKEENSDDSVDERWRKDSGKGIPILKIEKLQTVTIQLKNNDQLPGPSVNVSWSMDSLHIFMSPKLISLMKDFLNDESPTDPFAFDKEKGKPQPMTAEDIELCEKIYLEEERQRQRQRMGSLDSDYVPDVPQLSIGNRVDMMYGATAGSIMKDDMFYSTSQSVYKSSVADISDCASVSFDGNSTFSTTNASAFSHNMRSKERTRSYDEHTVNAHNVNVTIPFVTVTVLMEDPDPRNPPHHNKPPPTISSNAAKTTKSFNQKSNQNVQSSPVDNTEPFSSTYKSFTPSSIDAEVRKTTSDDDEDFFDSTSSHTIEGLSASSVDGKVPEAKAASSIHFQGSRTDFFRPAESNGNVSSVEDCLKIVAENLFRDLASLDFRLPIISLRDQVALFLQQDHIGLLAKPVNVDVVQEKKGADGSLKVKAAVGKLEVIECLFDCFSGHSEFAKKPLPKVPQYSVLLSFDVNGEVETTNHLYDVYNVFGDKPKQALSALSLTLETAKVLHSSRDASKYKLSLDLSKMSSEVDITIIDRLIPLLNHDPSGKNAAMTSTQLLDDNDAYDEAFGDERASSSCSFDIKVQATHASLRVRFPIPDLRPNKPSPSGEWCRRSLHKEMVVLELVSPKAGTVLQSEKSCSVELQVFKISAYLQEDINKNPVLFGEITTEKATPRDENCLDWPRLVVTVNNIASSELDAKDGEANSSGGSLETYMDLGAQEPSPFTRRRNLYTRDNLTCEEQVPVNDELVMPGTAEELKQFRETCQSHTTVSIEITVPEVKAFLHSKDFLELLYNRFNNDLLMWEPQTSGPMCTSMYNPSSHSLGVMHLIEQAGQMPSLAEPSYDSEDEESMHYSIHDGQYGGAASKPVTEVQQPTKLVFSLNIGSGKLLAVVPHPEKEGQDSQGEAHGEIMITLKDSLLFSVNAYSGDPDLKYLSFQANRIHMYHNSHVTDLIHPGKLGYLDGEGGIGVPQRLRPRIHRADLGVSENPQGLAGWGGDSPDMLTLVVKTKMDTINNVKNFTLALRVDGATLRHEMHHSGESWISQAIDLLDLTDFPILGYTLPKVMTEIHLQLEKCSVDYRPLHLPLRSFLTVEHFSVCSNIIADSSASQIRLMLDNSALFLSKKPKKHVSLLHDYVCVAEMDQFKIWLQFCYNQTSKLRVPKSDLRFLCDQLRVYTCADSAHALLELIQYLVNEGDLEDETVDLDGSQSDAEEAGMMGEAGDAYSSSPSHFVPAITPEQEASVVSALEEAMTDNEVHDSTKAEKGNKSQGAGTQVFFQYDGPESTDQQAAGLSKEFGEAMHLTCSQYSDSSKSGLEDGGEAASGKKHAEEDFEFVDSHFKNVANIKGSHLVQQLTPDPIEVIPDFVPKPTASYDHLQAPAHFPSPECQYTLREMSVLWYIYGGTDFSIPSVPQGRLQPPHLSPQSPRRIPTTRRNSWRLKGGVGRDLDVLMELDLRKIRFRYEVYPTTTKQASRFKLLVNSVEIRDRIQASEINKFLVKLVDKENPEQASAYMLMFSGVFTRPEHLPFREECDVKAFCLPIKLNVDQGSLNFLRRFISTVADSDPDTPGSSTGGSGSSGRSSPLVGRSSSPRTSVSSTEPIMCVGEPSMRDQSLDEAELLMKFDNFSTEHSQYLQTRLNETDNMDVAHENLPVFIKSFVLINDVTIKLDYRGKRGDMDPGVMGMVLGVMWLNGSVIKLKKINYQKGILGWNKLVMYTAYEWLRDIQTNQIHNLLKGVGSFSIICQIIQGVTDLIRLPIEQYQKDRRIIRGLQRGANSFTLNTVMALLELTNKVVGSIQYCAELGYDMMSPGPSVRRKKQQKSKARQPRTTAEGAKAALQCVTDGVKESASNLSAIISEEGAHKGYVGVVGGTLRNAAPECLFKPLALLAEAGTNIVQGARNEVDPSVMKEEEDRWKLN